MRLVNGDPNTTQVVGPPDDGGDGSTTRVLIRPVFTREGDGRRRLLARSGYVAAVSGLAYLAMVLVSVTASPAARPAAVAAPEAVAPTTVRQVTPERPSRAPVVAAPVTIVRVRPPVVTRPAPAQAAARTTPPAPPPSAAPTTTAKPPKNGNKTSSAAANRTTAATKTTKPSRGA